jgi:hypothetical protein
MAYTPTTNKEFVEPRYYSQYDEVDLNLFNEAIEASRHVSDIGERIDTVVAYLQAKHILCGVAQRVLIFDAIYEEVGPFPEPVQPEYDDSE